MSKKELYFDMEIMKVKMEQMEKRIDLLEKTLSFFERAHRAEMTAAAFSQPHPHKYRDTHDTDTDDAATTSSEEVDLPSPPKGQNKHTGYMRRII